MVLQGCFKVASRILKGYLADNSWIFKDTLVIVETMFLFFYLNDNLLLEKPPKDNIFSLTNCLLQILLVTESV